MKFVLSEEACRALRDYLGTEKTADGITLHVGPGHSGDGVYVSATEYPEDGADFLGAGELHGDAMAWLDKNTTFYDVKPYPKEGPNIPVLAAASKRIWYHATDDQAAPFSEMVKNAMNGG